MSRVKNEFLQVPSIDKFLELLSEEPTVDCAMTHPVMKSTIVASFGAFRLGESGLRRFNQDWSWMALKIRSMEVLNRVKFVSTSKTSAGFQEELGRDRFLKLSCPRIWAFFGGTNGCFTFSPSFSCLKSRLVEPRVVSSS